MSAALPLVAAALGAFAATGLLAALARRVGWLDRPAGAEAARKLQARPVPPVGGAVLLGTGALALAMDGAARADLAAALAVEDGRAVALALALAFAAGTLDDLGRLGGPLAKLGAQALAALPIALARSLERGSAAEGVGWLLLGVVALNAANTFDNSDGALASLALAGCALVAPLLGAVVAGFVPWNALAAAPPRAPTSAGGGAADAPRTRAAPRAYLGDAGSHLVGMGVLAVPALWPVLWVPALDLARLVVVRLAAGSRPWIGDRRHLAHRLERRGVPRIALLLLLVVAALPGLVGGLWGALGPGLAAGALLYGLLLVATRAGGRAEPERPARGP